MNEKMDRSWSNDLVLSGGVMVITHLLSIPGIFLLITNVFEVHARMSIPYEEYIVFGIFYIVAYYIGAQILTEIVVTPFVVLLMLTISHGGKFNTPLDRVRTAEKNVGEMGKKIEDALAKEPKHFFNLGKVLTIGPLVSCIFIAIHTSLVVLLLWLMVNVLSGIFLVLRKASIL